VQAVAEWELVAQHAVEKVNVSAALTQNSMYHHADAKAAANLRALVAADEAAKTARNLEKRKNDAASIAVDFIGDVARLERKVEALKAVVDVQRGEIGTLQADVAALMDAVAALQAAAV